MSNVRNIETPKCVNEAAIDCDLPIEASTVLDIWDGVEFGFNVGTSVVDARGLLVSNVVVPATGYSFLLGGQAIQERTREYRFNMFGGMTHLVLMFLVKLPQVPVQGANDHDLKVSLFLNRGANNQFLYGAKVQNINLPAGWEFIGTAEKKITIYVPISPNMLVQSGHVNETNLQVIINWEQRVGSTYGSPAIGNSFALSPNEWGGVTDLSLRLLKECP